MIKSSNQRYVTQRRQRNRNDRVEICFRLYGRVKVCLQWFEMEITFTLRVVSDKVRAGRLKRL
jgi:hypothetical protein